MRANANLFWLLAVFFALAAAAYAIWSSFASAAAAESATQFQGYVGPEWIGTVAISLSSIMSVFLGFYVTITRRAQGGELPEDRLDAAIDDGDPELGHFSPWSWWPLVLAFALALLFLGLAVGIWIAFIAAPLVIIGVIGWQFEYYRNFFAR